MVLDISQQKGTYVLLDFNAHLCYNGEFSSIYWPGASKAAILGREFSSMMLSHPALIGYYVFDEDDKLYGWGGSACKGYDKYLPTVMQYNEFVAGSGKKLFALTYSCLDTSSECGNTPVEGPQSRALPFEQDKFFAGYQGHFDAAGYFVYPYGEPQYLGGGSRVEVARSAMEQTARLAASWGIDSFFAIEGYYSTDPSALAAGARWPTEQEYRDLRKTAESYNIKWLAFWGERGGVSETTSSSTNPELWERIKQSILHD
jgi:hypothetical protein